MDDIKISNSWIELNRSHLFYNAAQFSKIVGSAQFVPVIKSNAYGHGLQQIYDVLDSKNLEWLAVNSLSEALTLRLEFGFEGRLLVMGPVSPKAINQAIDDALRRSKNDFSIDLMVGSKALLQACLEINKSSRRSRILIHLKIDTGMGRQGFLPDEMADVLKSLSSNAAINGVASHFSNVEDVLDMAWPMHQIGLFEYWSARVKEKFPLAVSHIASSASTLILPGSRFDLCRVGISLYGVWPSKLTRNSYFQMNGNTLDLRPVLSWKCSVSLVKELKKGDNVGYGNTYQALESMKIAVLPVGYFEGLPRQLSNKGSVLIGGEPCPIVGRICMNMCMVNVSHVEVKAGDVATIIGDDKTKNIGADDLAEMCHTINYEIFCGINPDLPRVVC